MPYLHSSLSFMPEPPRPRQSYGSNPEMAEMLSEWTAFKAGIIGMEARLKRLESESAQARVYAPRERLPSVRDLAEAVERFEEATEAITGSHHIPPVALPSERVRELYAEEKRKEKLTELEKADESMRSLKRGITITVIAGLILASITFAVGRLTTPVQTQPSTGQQHP